MSAIEAGDSVFRAVFEMVNGIICVEFKYSLIKFSSSLANEPGIYRVLHDEKQGNWNECHAIIETVAEIIDHELTSIFHSRSIDQLSCVIT